MGKNVSFEDSVLDYILSACIFTISIAIPVKRKSGLWQFKCVQYLITIKIKLQITLSMIESRYLFKLEIIQSSSMTIIGMRLKPNAKIRPVKDAAV